MYKQYGTCHGPECPWHMNSSAGNPLGCTYEYGCPDLRDGYECSGVSCPMHMGNEKNVYKEVRGEKI